MLESNKYVFHSSVTEDVLLVEETVIPSMCAEFDPNGDYTLGYRFYIVGLDDLSVIGIPTDEARGFYKGMQIRRERIQLWYILKSLK